MRLIDADVLKEHIDKLPALLDGNFAGNHSALKALINMQPTIEPSAQPEIVHCENCKHWKNDHLCECLSRYGTFETPKDFYCGYGKAK
jgi:hypothetical protein